jgi:hypothetical protein
VIGFLAFVALFGVFVKNYYETWGSLVDFEPLAISQVGKLGGANNGSRISIIPVPSSRIDNETNTNTYSSTSSTSSSSAKPTSSQSTTSITHVVPVDNLLGTIQDGRLIVNIDQAYMFWKSAQSKLCQVLRNMTSLVDHQSPSTELSAIIKINNKRPLLNATIDCVALSFEHGLGQGNWVTALYATRIAAAFFQMDFSFQCSDGRDSQMKLLLPWFSGYHSAPSPDNPWPYTGTLPTEYEACTDKYPRIRVDKIADQIINDIQKMAVTLVGFSQGRSHPGVPVNQRPLIPDVTLDDAVIHFRCGDVMGGAKRNDFGMIKFSEYPKWISHNAQRIGILTQPFDKDRNRPMDQRKTEGCRAATYLLVDYLQKSYPKTTISIHNGPNETLPLAYARLAMANQSFTSLSSFGIFPVIGTFGDGYFQKGNGGINPFATNLPEFFPHLHQMEAPSIGTGTMFRMKTEEILDWFISP